MLISLATAALVLATGAADPADYSTTITNPYLPLRPGHQWVYRVGKQRDVVTVTPTPTPPLPLRPGHQWVYRGGKQRDVVPAPQQTKRMPSGIEARVVRDEVTVKGAPAEITDDYYAQDRKGNVWYLGEATTEY